MTALLYSQGEEFPVPSKDFFISYNKADRQWATWIAFALEENNQYTTMIQDWDFRPGGNFVLDMQRAMTECERTIAVLSVDYLAAIFTQPEWAAAFRADPTGSSNTLVPVRVGPCQPPGLLSTIVYIDLVGRDPVDAKTTLLDGVRRDRRKPVSEPAFPGQSNDREKRQDNPRAVARKLRDLLATTETTFLAQARLRDELYTGLRHRLGVQDNLQYERFFAKYYADMTPAEKQIHETIRSYTGNVLADYNTQILGILNEHGDLALNVAGIGKLKLHLTLWLAKVKGVFATTPAMSLVYVGVEEGVPFPKELEPSLATYLGEPLEGQLIGPEMRESLHNAEERYFEAADS